MRTSTVSIGRGKSSKLSFFGTTPIVKQTLSTSSNNMSYLNCWNQLRPGGRRAFMPLSESCSGDEVGTYQTLPWNMVGWHSGEGANGTAYFMGYIGFEICEDDLTDRAYFEKVYREAVELCVYLCQQFDLTEKEILCHSSGDRASFRSNFCLSFFAFSDTLRTFLTKTPVLSGKLCADRVLLAPVGNPEPKEAHPPLRNFLHFLVSVYYRWYGLIYRGENENRHTVVIRNDGRYACFYIRGDAFCHPMMII